MVLILFFLVVGSGLFSSSLFNWSFSSGTTFFGVKQNEAPTRSTSVVYSFGPITYSVAGATRLLSENSCWQFSAPPCYDNTTSQTEVYLVPSQSMIQINISSPTNPYPANDSIKNATSEIALGISSSNPGGPTYEENQTGSVRNLSIVQSFEVNSSSYTAQASFQINSCFYTNSSLCADQFSRLYRDIIIELYAKPSFTLYANADQLRASGIIMAFGTIQPYWEDIFFRLSSTNGLNVSAGDLEPATSAGTNQADQYSKVINLTSIGVDYRAESSLTLSASAIVDNVTTYDDLPSSYYGAISSSENVSFSTEFSTTGNSTSGTSPPCTTSNQGSNCMLPPVILIPGIGGTSLYADPTHYNQVWPCVGDDCQSAMSFAEPSDYASLSLDQNGSSSVATIGDILENGVCSEAGEICNVYGSLTAYLMNNLGYKEGIDLYVFPYDWRLSYNASFTNLTSMIQTALSNTNSRNVTLISFGTGGVFARSYLISNPQNAAEINSLISVGTPFWGSPRGLSALINGETLGNPTIDQETMKILSQNMPSVYELSCQFTCVYDQTGGLSVGLNFSQLVAGVEYSGICVESGTECPSTPLGSNATQGLLTNSSTQLPYYLNGTIGWRLNPSLADNFYTLANSLGSMSNPAPLPGAVKQYAIIGYGISTLGFFDLKPAQSATGIIFDGQPVSMVPEFVDGDGTYQVSSEQLSTATATYYVPYSSNDSSGLVNLPSNQKVQSIIASIVRGNPLPEKDFSYNLSLGNSSPLSGEKFSVTPDTLIRISDSRTNQTLGFNPGGGVNGTAGTGSFVSTLSGNFAAFENANDTYLVTVQSLENVRSTLSVNLTVNGQLVAYFTYRNVSLTKDAVASLQINGTKILAGSKIPSLSVRTGAAMTEIPPDVQYDTISKQTVSQPSSSFDLFNLTNITLIGIAIAVLIAASVVTVVRRSRVDRREKTDRKIIEA